MAFLHLLVVFIGFSVVYGQTYEDVATLRQNLLQNYTRSLPPVKTQNTTVQVSLMAGARTIQEFDVVSGVLSLQLYLYQMWMDEYITWTPQQYGNVSVIYIPIPEVWVPQLVVLNSVDEYDFMAQFKDFQLIEYSPTGNAQFSYAASIKTMCEPNVKYFPFDIHFCDVLLICPSYGLEDAMPFPLGTSVEYFVPNGQWNMEISSFTQEVFTFGNYHLKLRLRLSRRPYFLVINLFIPIIFRSLMSLFVFVLPVESGEKASYSITVLLSLAIFMTIVMDQLPSISTHSPMISIALLIHLTMNVVVCVCTIFSLNYYYRKNTQPIPWHLRVLVTAAMFKRYASTNNVIDATVTNTSDKVWQEKEDIAEKVGGSEQAFDTDQTPSLTWPLVSLAVDRLTLFVCLTGIAVEVVVLVRTLFL